MNPPAAILAVALLCSVVAGCGGVGAKQNEEVTITVTSRANDEEEILREIYALSLEAAGFQVKLREFKPGQLATEELETGRVSGYPDYLDAALTVANPAKADDVPTSPMTAHRELRQELEEKDLVPFSPAPFSRTKAIGITRETAERERIKTLSDLKGPAGGMQVLELELKCHGRSACLEGFERYYGIAFESFVGISPLEPSPGPYKALKTGETDAVMLVTTEGQLARKGDWLVLLEDEEHRLPAANAFWMTSQDVIDEAGLGYEKAILAAQKGLTVEVMRELNAKVELEGKAPAKVAAEYLKSVGD